jgi:hypothetical protein
MVVFSLPKTTLDNVPSTLGLHNQFELWRSLPAKVRCLHVIFHLNGVLVAKRALGFHMRMWTNSTLAFKPKLKDFLTSCLFQFKVYISSATQCYNINKYLEEIKE